MSNANSAYAVRVLGTENYKGRDDGWYGDCIIIYDAQNKEMVVYDCGSEQHADEVVKFMNANGIAETSVILSHNDSDHFDGIPKLIQSGKVGNIFTTLLLQHIDEIFGKFDDDRRTEDATKEHILELYSNIAELSGESLKDIYGDESALPSGITFIGPDKDTMFKVVAKAIEENDLQSKEGKETLVNSTSLQIEIPLRDGKKMLLLGDADVGNVTCKLDDYKYIQLPHHGKKESAEAVFDKVTDNFANHTFFISDNTGSSNGGSDELMASPEIIKGKEIKNTKTGNLDLGGVPTFKTITDARKDYGICGGI